MFLMNGSLKKRFCTVYKICISFTKLWYKTDKVKEINKEVTVDEH